MLAFKGNQGDLHADVDAYFTKALEMNFKHITHDFYEEHDAGHGRIEYRQCWSSLLAQQPDCFSNQEKWKGLKSLVIV